MGIFPARVHYQRFRWRTNPHVFLEHRSVSSLLPQERRLGLVHDMQPFLPLVDGPPWRGLHFSIAQAGSSTIARSIVREEALPVREPPAAP